MPPPPELVTKFELERAVLLINEALQCRSTTMSPPSEIVTEFELGRSVLLIDEALQR